MTHTCVGFALNYNHVAVKDPSGSALTSTEQARIALNLAEYNEQQAQLLPYYKPATTALSVNNLPMCPTKKNGSTVQSVELCL